MFYRPGATFFEMKRKALSLYGKCVIRPQDLNKQLLIRNRNSNRTNYNQLDYTYMEELRKWAMSCNPPPIIDVGSLDDGVLEWIDDEMSLRTHLFDHNSPFNKEEAISCDFEFTLEDSWHSKLFYQYVLINNFVMICDVK